MRNSIKMAGHRKSVKKAMEDYVDRGEQELDLQDRAIENLLDVPFLSKHQALLDFFDSEKEQSDESVSVNATASWKLTVARQICCVPKCMCSVCQTLDEPKRTSTV